MLHHCWKGSVPQALNGKSLLQQLHLAYGSLLQMSILEYFPVGIGSLCHVKKGVFPSGNARCQESEGDASVRSPISSGMYFSVGWR